MRTNGNGISCGQFRVENNSTVNLSSSNITVYGNSCNITSPNFIAGTSTILLANSGSSFPGDFDSDNDFYNLVIESVNLQHTVDGSGSFNRIEQRGNPDVLLRDIVSSAILYHVHL